MPKYLLKVRYDPEGIGGVMRDGGTRRRAAAEELVKAVGGSIECFYFAFGEDDAYLICDLPDNAAAAAASMTASSTGRVSTSTVPLLTLEELDAVSTRPRADYRPPTA